MSWYNVGVNGGMVMAAAVYDEESTAVSRQIILGEVWSDVHTVEADSSRNAVRAYTKVYGRPAKIVEAAPVVEETAAKVDEENKDTNKEDS